MIKECKNCKSFNPTVYPLHCGDPNRNPVMDGLCQKDNERHDSDDYCDKFEEKGQRNS